MELSNERSSAWDVLRRRCITVVFVLTSTSLLAQDFLSEFVDVKTRTHVDQELGFTVEYPYEWEPSANPMPESDFYVGAPYAMPSFWLTVRDIPSGQKLQNSLISFNLSATSDGEAIEYQLGVANIGDRVITSESVEFNGHEAMKGVIRWTTEDAGRHFVETTIISFYANERWYHLTVNQSYRDTRWRPRLQALLDSFTVLESES